MTASPDHRDADIVLKLYDLRREAVMRASRDSMNAHFHPRSLEELSAVLKLDHPQNAAFRQVSTYWEMVYNMARRGIVNPEYLVESSGEGMLLFSKVKPHLAELRQATSPRAFANAEWVANNTDAGRAYVEFFTKRLAAAPAR